MAKSLNLLKEVKAVIERIEEHDVAAENGDLFQMIGEKYKDNIVEFLRILKLVESEINDCLKKKSENSQSTSEWTKKVVDLGGNISIEDFLGSQLENVCEIETKKTEKPIGNSDDELLLECAERYETSLLESPVQGEKDFLSPCETKRNNDESDDDLLLESEQRIEVEKVTSEAEEDAESVDDQKYIHVLKRYFGFSNFRK